MPQPFRILLSYWYHRAEGLPERLAGTFGNYPLGIMADSGAISVQSLQAPVQLPDYAEWLRDHGPLFDVYANLDVIGEPEATAANQQALEERGLHPMPVFHGGSPWPVLEKLCERYDYIALGNLTAPHHREKLWPWLARCFQIADRHGTRFHGFGLTDWKAMIEWPFYSVDSSSWGAGHRFGAVPLWDGRRMVKLDLRRPATVWRQAKLIRSFGVEPATLADRDRYHHSVAAGIAAASWLRMAERIGRTRNLRVYLADSNLTILGYGLQGHLRAQEAQ